MYSFPDLDPVCCSMSSSNCCLLTCIQISQKARQVAWYSHLLKNFPQFVVIHTIKCFGILGISELKWTGVGEFNSNDHYIYYRGQESLRRNEVAIIVNERVQNAVLRCNLKNDRMIFVCFQGKPFNITIIQVYALTSNAEEAEVEWFYEDLQDLLELTPPKDVIFTIGDWTAKVGSQENPGITGKFGLGVQNEAGKRLIEFFQENTLIIANTLFQQHKRRLYTWTLPDGQ